MIEPRSLVSVGAGNSAGKKSTCYSRFQPNFDLIEDNEDSANLDGITLSKGRGHEQDTTTMK